MVNAKSIKKLTESSKSVAKMSRTVVVAEDKNGVLKQNPKRSLLKEFT